MSGYKNILKKNLFLLDHLSFKYKKIKTQDTLIISGTPRSGTTWLMEIIEKLPKYASVFEPLNPKWFPDAKLYGFNSRTYVPLNTDWKRGEKYLHKVFSGKIISKNPNYNPDPKFIIKRLLSNKIVVKFIRANRLLPWIQEKFQLKGIIHIIRHPCATINSQLEKNYFGYNYLTKDFTEKMPSKEVLINEISQIKNYKSFFLNIVKNFKHKEEILAAIWCIDNIIPLTSIYVNKLYILTYESLISEGLKELKKLYTFFGEKLNKASINQLLIPSRLTKGENPKKVLNLNYQINKWKTSLNENQINRIIDVVHEFGLDFYTRDIIPNNKALHSFIDNNFYNI
ncbi:MAG: sulfotransferase domain-containing protein [Candidatus Hermodarchaeota archaeon]